MSSSIKNSPVSIHSNAMQDALNSAIQRAKQSREISEVELQQAAGGRLAQDQNTTDGSVDIAGVLGKPDVTVGMIYIPPVFDTF